MVAEVHTALAQGSCPVNSQMLFDYDLQAEVLDTSPTHWGLFVFFAEKQNKKETYWRILAGGRHSELVRMSESVHHADAYTIACGSSEMAPKVFKMTVTEAIAKGP